MVYSIPALLRVRTQVWIQHPNKKLTMAVHACISSIVAWSGQVLLGPLIGWPNPNCKLSDQLGTASGRHPTPCSGLMDLCSHVCATHTHQKTELNSCCMLYVFSFTLGRIGGKILAP